MYYLVSNKTTSLNLVIGQPDSLKNATINYDIQLLKERGNLAPDTRFVYNLAVSKEVYDSVEVNGRYELKFVFRGSL